MEQNNHKRAVNFVILLGVVSLFADITSHGAKSIIGVYLANLGANAAIVGFVAGFGECVAYGLRFFSGYFVDKTGKYWMMTLFGYACNLIAVPLLALSNSWPSAAILVIAERTGKAVRTPARDAMLSYAGYEMGRGWVFGLHQALDQFGAMLGPIVVTFLIYIGGGYQRGFAMLIFPAAIAFALLLVSTKLYPKPQDLEVSRVIVGKNGIPRSFYLYLVASSLVAAGYTDFPLAAYHFAKTSSLKPILIPLFYAISMGASSLASLILGRFYDRKGRYILLITIVMSSFFSPLIFLGGVVSAFFGMILWGCGMGAQLSLMKAIIGDMVAKERRGYAYGLFNAVYGVLWFAGSAIMGLLYDISISWMVIFSIGVQFLSFPIFIVFANKNKNGVDD